MAVRGVTRWTSALILALLAGAAARAETLEDPGFDAKFAEFKKLLKVGPETPQMPDPKVARATVDGFAATRDARVLKELFGALPRSAKACAEAHVTLDEVSQKHKQAMQAYFAWLMEEYRLTGKLPTTILVVHKDAIEAWKKKLEAAAAYAEVREQIHDGLKSGLGTNLVALDAQRELVWKAAVERGLKAKEPDERAAFALALGTLGGAEAEAILLKLEAEEKEAEALVAVLDGLAALATPGAFPRVAARTADPRWPVTAAALQALRRFRHADVVPTLVKFLGTTKDERLTIDAYEILFDVTGKHLADDPAPWAGWWKEQGEEFLRRWSTDAKERTSEIEKIAFIDPSQADVAAELAALLPTEPDPAVRKEILANLSIHKTYHARIALLRAIHDPRKEIVVTAVRGLAHMQHLSVPEALMGLVDGADEELLTAIFQSLRTLWGGEEEFAVTRPDANDLRRWWDDNKDRVVDQFLRLGARDIAAGKPARGAEDESSQSRTFYGLHVRSSRVLFCVDNSLSMDEPYRKDEKKKKIDVAKEELARVIKALPDGGTFGIILFAGYPTIYETGMMKLTKKTREKAIEWVQALKMDPGTNIYDTFELAFQLGTPKSTLRSADSPDTIYFVSDGDPTVGKYLETGPILDYVRRVNIHRRVKIHTIGVGYDHNVNFLRSLAEQNGGVYAAR